jgi:biopolymer transport protein ExbB
MPKFDTGIFPDGGPIMWLLLLLSIYGFVVFLERLLFLHRGQIRSGDYIDGIHNLLRKERRLEALTLCEDVPGPVPAVVKAVLMHIGASAEAMQQAAQEAAMVEIPALERRIGAIAAIARIAPLLGLLGSVLGLTRAFLEIRVSGAAFPHYGDMFAGMGEALITTVFGLIIAVMAHVAHYFLDGRVRAIVHDMEYSAHRLIQFIHAPEAPATEDPA